MAQVLRDADQRLHRPARGPAPRGRRARGRDRQGARRPPRRAARAGHRRAPGDRHLGRPPGASARIARFAAGSGRWLVSVLMVSEGVDVPRLRVGVYATTARTELFFRQVVGRFVRRTPAPREQMSHLFLASDPRLKALAAQIEEERNHALEQRGGGRGGGRAARARRGERGVPRAVVERPPRRRRPAARPQPGEALQLFADAGARLQPPRRAGRLHHHRGGPSPRGGRDGPRAPRAPARRAPRPRRRRLAPHGRGAPRDPRPHQPRDGRRLGRRGDRRPARARQPPARAAQRAERNVARRTRPMLPDWPDGTVAVLSTGAGPPHAIPVSTAVRAGDRPRFTSRSACAASRSPACARTRAAR